MSKKSSRTPPKELRVLAVDPGYGRAGVAVVARANGHDTLLYSSCVITDAAQIFPDRLKAVCDAVEDLFARFKPELFALERLYFTSNQKTAMQVAEVRGALIALAAAHAVPILEYTPLQVKIAVTGYGKSSKQAVMHMVPRLVKIDILPKLDDEYDAIAIGLTALASYRA